MKKPEIMRLPDTEGVASRKDLAPVSRQCPLPKAELGVAEGGKVCGFNKLTKAW